MGKGPLEDPQLLEIEAKLNRAEFDEAQQLLALLSHRRGTEAAAAYFATRLLYQRGRLDNSGVAERLREVLMYSGSFPQAENMLAAAELDVLESSPEGFLRSTQPPFRPRSVAGPGTATSRLPAPVSVPRAPLLPRFSSHGGVARAEPPLERATNGRERVLELDPPSPRRLPAALDFDLDLDLNLDPKPAPSLSSAPAAPDSLPPAPDLMSSLSTAPPPAGAATSFTSTPPLRDQRATAPVTRSAAPDALEEPSLLEIARSLDAGNAEHALELLSQRGPPQPPEQVLLSARARAALGDHQRARRELEPLLRLGSLPAALRTPAARLLIELGAPEQAMDQAAAALEQDPDDQNARLTYAWALVRAMRRSGDLSRAHEVETLLATTTASGGAMAALALSLRASLLAARGPATRALSLAQAALRHDPKQADAIAAVALASIRLGLRDEAERATAELGRLYPDEAAALTRSLTQSTVPPPVPRHKPVTEPPLEALWGQAEAALVRGDPKPTTSQLEQACRRLVADAAREHDAPWMALARAAALLFTEQPVFRHFAPYDSSVFSIQRLASALDVLFADRAYESEPVVLVLGAYIGESVRQAYGGEWVYAELDARRAVIHAAGLTVTPCEQLRLRFTQNHPLLLPQPKRLHPGADPFGNTVPLSQSPPCPWDPESWPSPARLGELGRSLPLSIIGLHCQRVSGATLDHSLGSLERLDRYLDLLAPPDAPLDPDSGWVRRAALLVGGYLGEVLVSQRGARWHAVERADHLQAYRLDLPNGVSPRPAARIADRLSGRQLGSLSEYVNDLSGPSSARNPAGQRLG
jgi:tetratricopeptide (TPR) repeat protein